MRALITLVLLLALGYGGYWFVGANATERGGAALAETLRDRGWSIDYSDLKTRGFPSRFDTTVTDPAITAPSGRIGWRAAFLQVFALSYRPNQIIAALPPKQELTLGRLTLNIQTTEMQASASVRPALDAPFEAATIDVGPTRIGTYGGPSGGFQRGLLAARAAGPAAAYDLFAEVTELDLPMDNGIAVQRIRFDSLVTLADQLDRDVLTLGMPSLTAVTVRDLTLDWGTARLHATGDLAIGGDGTPQGALELTVTDWSALLDQMIGAGLLPEAQRADLSQAATLLALGGTDFAGTLAFAEGRIFLGPLAIGPALRLR